MVHCSAWTRDTWVLKCCAGGFGIRLDRAQSSRLYIGLAGGELIGPVSEVSWVLKSFEKDRVGSVAVGKWA